MILNCIAVEDERIIQMLLKRIFKQKLSNNANLLGIGGNAEEGRELIEKHRDELDVLFLDVILPDHNGFELLEELDLPEDVQIIMMSGDDIEDQSESYDITDIIIKPFDVERLQEALKKAESEINGKKAD